MEDICSKCKLYTWAFEMSKLVNSTQYFIEYLPHFASLSRYRWISTINVPHLLNLREAFAVNLNTVYTIEFAILIDIPYYFIEYFTIFYLFPPSPARSRLRKLLVLSNLRGVFFV
jgi:hypothetical protein